MTNGTQRISAHFVRSEFTFSATAIRREIDNEPAADQWPAIEALVATCLEPLRQALGPIRINSGYRCPALNALVGGSPQSQHMSLRRDAAADIRPVSTLTSLEDVMAWLYRWVPFDQMLAEFGAWVHVSHVLDGPQRGEVLRSTHGPDGRVVYSPYPLSDLTSRLV